MEQVWPYRMLWHKRGDGGARLLRLYGASPQIHVPQQADGCPIVEIAPYCFAAEQKFLPEDVTETTVLEPGSAAALQELHTKVIEEIWLPDCVERIGSYAFYNCRKLHTLTIGADTRDIGSDAFMNTLSLRTLSVRCGAGGQSGLRQILAQISSDLEVRLLADTEPEAVLLYPEYDESYNEVAPAHLFGRSILGEGFRARQCIRDGRVDFAGYDAVFLQACATEREETLSRMAINRLRYPYGLSARNRQIYRDYVTVRGQKIAQRLVRQRDLDGLAFFYRERLLDGAALFACVREASETEWAQGAAQLLAWMAEAEETSQKKRYDFEE